MQLHHLRHVALALALIGISQSALAVVIVDEDFESYADDAAFHQNWAGLAGSFSPGTQAEVEMQFELRELSAVNPDFNGNNVVDLGDYTIWRDNLGSTSGGQGAGDANGDGNVDAADYDAWKAQFGQAPQAGGSGKVVEHLINYVNQDPNAGPTRVPDGVVEYVPVLNPNNTEDGAVFPTEEEPVVAGVDIFVDERTSTIIQRNTLGLRNVFQGTTLDIVELGVYNDNTIGFAMRAVLWNGTSPGWQYFAIDPVFDADDDGTVEFDDVLQEFGPAWHRWEATIGPNSITATLDLNRDGINNATGEPGVDATLTFDEESQGAGFGLTFGFNNLRFGGPSNLYTTEHAYFDNIFFSGPQDALGAGAASANIPEPTSMVLAALGVVALMALRTRK